MKVYDLLFGKKANISKLKEIDKYVKYITSSCITNDNEDLDKLKIFRYSDDVLCIRISKWNYANWLQHYN